MNILYFSLFILVGSIISLINAHQQHPHGQQISVQLSEELNSANNKLNGIFAHPEIENRKVVVLSIAGAYRKGKSFFLNYCLRFLYANYRSINTLNQPFVNNHNWWGGDDEPLLGFSWKHGSDPDIKGILFWSDVFLHEENGENIAIILMDTQDIFGFEADHQLDAKVLGITNFISSIQILNINNFIEDHQLEHLKLVTDFAELTKKRQNENLLTSTSKPFQKLLILFRDWSDEEFGYRYGPGYDGGELYLKRVLNSKVGTNLNVQDVQNNIKDSYDNIDAFLLTSPGEIISDETFDGRWNLLNDEFKVQIKTLIESILSPKNLAIKKIFDKKVTAKELLKYILLIFAAFKGSDAPKSKFIFDSFIKPELTELSEQAVNEYMKKMRQSTDHTNPNYAIKLLTDHNRIKMEVIEIFKNVPKMTSKNEFIGLISLNIEIAFLNWKPSVKTLHDQYIAHKKQLEYQAWQSLQARREGARRIYEKTPQYKSCRFFTMYMHDCGMTNNVNSVT
ncbi:hypothetical protein ACKWTF_003234 [Chironomus riparius]